MKLMDTWNKNTPLLKHILDCIEGKTIEEAQCLITDEIESVLWRTDITPMEERRYLQALYDASAFNYLRESVARLKAAEAGLAYETMEKLALPERYPITDVDDLENEHKIVSTSPIYMLHRVWHDDLVRETLESEADGLFFIKIEIGNGITIKKERTLL